MGGSQYPTSSRVMAVKAYYQAVGHYPTATKIFLEMIPDPQLRPAAANVRSFIEYWQTIFDQTGRVDVHAPPGQKPRMPDDVAEKCIELLLAGYTFRNKRYYFTSVNDALKRNSELKALADQYGYNNNTLLKRLKKTDHTLTRRVLHFVKQLSRSTKDERLQYCWLLLLRGQEGLRRYLARVIWVDSKKMYICPEDYLVYAPKDANLLVTDHRLPNSSYDVKKINYYAATNAVLGPVFFKICTGTTGYKELCSTNPAVMRLYKVGAASRADSYAYDLVCQTKLLWGFSFTVLMASCSRRAHCLSSAWWKRRRRSPACLHLAS
jgi:hypothetical protein